MFVDLNSGKSPENDFPCWIASYIFMNIIESLREKRVRR
jgi:hypothetical protein